MAIDRYFTLGNSGLKVSRLALGTMTFGTEWDWGNNKKDSKAIFDHYIDAGGNFLDTADFYTEGTSEKYLGEFIRDRKIRDEVVLATKYTFNTAKNKHVHGGGNGRKNLRKSVEDSLRRLGTDYIDLYIMHCWDMLTPVEEVMRTMDDLVSEGKILHVGLSDVPAWYASRAQTLAEWKNYAPVSAFQMEYSLIERNIENEFADLAQLTGAGIMAWSPLGGGLLSGKYKPNIEGQKNVEGRLKQMTDSGSDVSSKDNDRNWKIVSALEEVANELNQPMASVALNWTANRPGIGTVLVGATKMKQIKANMKCLDFKIPAELMKKLNDASSTNPDFPYKFFTEKTQERVNGDHKVGNKPESYWG